jgi:hypothetical protein
MKPATPRTCGLCGYATVLPRVAQCHADACPEAILGGLISRRSAIIEKVGPGVRWDDYQIWLHPTFMWEVWRHPAIHMFAAPLPGATRLFGIEVVRSPDVEGYAIIPRGS